MTIPHRHRPVGVLLLGLLFVLGIFVVLLVKQDRYDTRQATCNEACVPHPGALRGTECFCERGLERPKNSRVPVGDFLEEGN